MFLSISDDIDNTILEKVIDAYNLLQEGDKMHVYLNSRGGEFPSFQAILHIINLNAKITTIYAYNHIGSCAFELFFKAKCEKHLIEGCMGQYHQSSLPVNIYENVKTKDFDFKTRTDYMKKFARKNTLQLCHKLGLTESENDKIQSTRDGADFTGTRMKELLKNAKAYDKKQNTRRSN